MIYGPLYERGSVVPIEEFVNVNPLLSFDSIKNVNVHLNILFFLFIVIQDLSDSK